MDALWMTGLVVFALAGVALSVFQLPGAWLTLAAAVVFDWHHGWARLGWKWLAVLAVMAVAAEVFEFAASARARKSDGRDNPAMPAMPAFNIPRRSTSDSPSRDVPKKFAKACRP